MTPHEEPGSVPEVAIGMLGYAFMGRAHSNAWRTIPWVAWPPPLRPALRVIAGRDAAAVHDTARRFGYERATTDWREIVAAPDVDVLDNGGPNALHAEPCIAAAEAGKHVLCEKPLGRDADEAHRMWTGVEATGVVHMTAFNYRFYPAVQLARQLVEAGEIGEVRHFRARYLQESLVDPRAPWTWRLSQEEAGSGALGDLGAHIVDQARFLVGEPDRVTGVLRTFVPTRPGGTVDVDEAFAATVEFATGAIGTLEASKVAPGRKNQMAWEINGTKGSIAFDQERMNELQVHLLGSAPGTSAQGFRTVIVSERDHPYQHLWWPRGHLIGWEHVFVHELLHFLGAVRGDHGVAPLGATFEDGYRCAEVCDAIARSARTGQREEVRSRS